MPPRYDVRSVTTQLIALIQDDVLSDLQTEEPELAVEVHFHPVRVQQLPPARISGDNCSVDGYYEKYIDPTRPRILYSDTGGAARARFTILHELGHHIFNTVGESLLDDLDRIAGPTGDPTDVEEAACHQFAGEVLVPGNLLEEAIGDNPTTPTHILRLSERVQASWEAIAVRVANYSHLKTAVALVRQQGEVSFVATNWRTAWRRDSPVKPGGPLDQALVRNSTARNDVFRYGLGGAEQMFCDTVQVHERLALAVLTLRASDGGLSILEEVEPSWKTREEYCEWCSQERNVGWCYTCKRRKCPTCDRCACQKPTRQRTCPQCLLLSPFRPGAQVCKNCEKV